MHYIAMAIMFCGMVALCAVAPATFEEWGGRFGLTASWLFCFAGPIFKALAR